MLAFAPRRGFGAIDGRDPADYAGTYNPSESTYDTSGLAADDVTPEQQAAIDEIAGSAGDAGVSAADSMNTDDYAWIDGFESGSLGGSLAGAASPAAAQESVAVAAASSSTGKLHGEAAYDAGLHVGITDAETGKAYGASKGLSAGVIAVDGMPFYEKGYADGYVGATKVSGGGGVVAPKPSPVVTLDPVVIEEAPPGMSYGAKVAIGLGAAAAVGLAVVVAKKKRRRAA